MHDTDLLLTAGPTPYPAAVRSALAGPALSPDDPAFVELVRRVEGMLRQLFGAAGDVVVLQGEAVLGLEAAARGLVRPGMPVLNLVQGVFGHYMGLWLEQFGAVVHEVRVPYDRAVPPSAVADALAAHPEIELVCAVGCETPSGTVSDLEGIGAVVREHGALALVDAVAALGATPFDADAWGWDVAVSAPHKVLGGTAGLSLLSVSERAWTALGANPSAPRGSYLSLLDWKERWLEGGSFPYVPSPSDWLALDAALDELLREGLDAAARRHAVASAAVRAGVRALGLRLWADDDAIAAPVVTAVHIPEGIDPDHLCRVAHRRYGVLMSSGQGAGDLVRIAHMGSTASGLHPVIGIAALGRALADLGVGVDIGSGAAAVLAVLSDNAGSDRSGRE
ncbi:pyridoxal-phosphate-dependent aminotransferase family protein [Schumannella soli]|uniref:Alanine--glyoxylate aminotransferase family protein n=1 Tax=Schumannella soli TaxID=2590779 RepID=A0A506XWZ6_9MICO|nr:alanine--glyoxylate aminotransferase family protein [Schumannella soli]TPW77424.1 alanine--glyoxylate aminotransferase family protein [Schumannella soli]